MTWRRSAHGQLRKGPKSSPGINIGQMDALELLAKAPSTGAAGKLYAGDAAPTVVGSGGSAPAYASANYSAYAVGEELSYVRVGTGWVALFGSFKSSVAIADGSTVFTFPAGWRPVKTMRVPMHFWNGGYNAKGLLYLLSNGAVQLYGLGTYVANTDIGLNAVFPFGS